VKGSQLETKLSLEDYSVSNRGLRTGLVGTPEQVADRLRALEEIGIELVLLQFSPQREEMDRFAADVFPLVGKRAAASIPAS
jgi:FMNH2-dependent dimethyl sulfone monooxygenase